MSQLFFSVMLFLLHVSKDSQAKRKNRVRESEGIDIDDDSVWAGDFAHFGKRE